MFEECPRHRVLPSNVVFRRIIWIVLDSVGIGAMPDAAAYGDPPGGDTLGNIARIRGLRAAQPRARSGSAISSRSPASRPPRSRRLLTDAARWLLPAKTRPPATGKWPASTSTSPFRFTRTASRRRSCTNSSAASAAAASATRPPPAPRSSRSSATSTCAPARPSSTPPPTACSRWPRTKKSSRSGSCTRSARRRATFCAGPHEVGRVIARPFIGSPGNFTRTANRHDYAVPPPQGHAARSTRDRGVPVHSVGKIFDVFLGRGIPRSAKTEEQRRRHGANSRSDGRTAIPA